MLSKNQIKEIQSLQLKKFRDEKKQFVIEGIKTVEEVLQNKPILLHHVFATSLFLNKYRVQLRQLSISFTEIDEDDLKKISLQANPNQVLAVCNYFKKSEYAFDFNTHFSFYLDDIRDPGNLGTIIRMADWFGVSTLFCSPTTCELYNPKVIQSTMGSFMRINLYIISLEELIAKQKIKNVYGAVLNGKNVFKEKLHSGLIVIGNEANGIHKDNFKFITHNLTIPAHAENKTESLNAAMATGIIMGEFFRQLSD